jgi:plastocyanin
VRKWGGTVRQSTWPVALVCAAALLAAGCGSSKSTSTATKTSTTATVKEGIVANGKINYASPPANAPVQSGLVKIVYHEFAIEPDTLKAKVGSTIKWINNGPQTCNVTSEGGPYKFASKDFGEGASFELKLDKPGVIHYECTSYPITMNGTIEAVS